MSRIAYVNGSYVPHSGAVVHIEDRGYQFADAVYEVVAVLNGQILDLEPHLNRLARSLNNLHIPTPMSDSAISVILRQMVLQNRLRNGILYFQVSRGVAPREHGFPEQYVAPSMVVTAKRLCFDAIKKKQQKGISVNTTVETRWARPDIKTVCLLANVLAKAEANDEGATDAWFVDKSGMVTEGTANNAWIIKDNTIITRALSNDILAGITRQTLLSVAKNEGLKIIERSFSVDEAISADEAFITSTTNFVMPVVSIDGQKIGKGKPGAICQKLIKSYWDILGD